MGRVSIQCCGPATPYGLLNDEQRPEWDGGAQHSCTADSERIPAAQLRSFYESNFSRWPAYTGRANPNGNSLILPDTYPEFLYFDQGSESPSERTSDDRRAMDRRGRVRPRAALHDDRVSEEDDFAATENWQYEKVALPSKLLFSQPALLQRDAPCLWDQE